MSFHKFPKISINIFGGIFLFLFFFVSLFPPEADAPLAQIFIRSAFAQDAIQCTPGDVNLNRNLRFVDNDNIYLGTGYLNFSSGNNGIYAANDSSNLLFRNDSAQIINRSNTIEFQNTAGNRLTGIYNSNPSQPAVNGNHYFIVDGAIEGYAVNGLNELCVQGSCINSWPTSCIGTQKLTASGNTFSCSDDVDTDTQCDTSGTCNQLCIGTSCYNSWASAISSNGGGVSSINNGSGISVSTTTGDVTVSNTGVTRLIAGSGVTLSSETGDVTISAAGGGGGGLGPCAAGFTRVGNECRVSFGREVFIKKISSLNVGSDPSVNNWATLDVPDLNGTNAIFAIVRSLCSENIMYIRETGSGITTIDTTNELCYGDNNATDWNRYTTGFRYIKLDANKDFDWYNIPTDPPTLDGSIYLVGYTESDAGGGGGGGGGSNSDWKLLARGSDNTEEAIITMSSSGASFETDYQVGGQYVNIGMLNWPSGSVNEIAFTVHGGDARCIGGGFTNNLTTGVGVWPKCQQFYYQGTTLTRQNINEDDAIKLVVNGVDMDYCPDQYGRVSDLSSFPGTWAESLWQSPICYYRVGIDYASSNITNLQIKEIDWSPALGVYDWEIWYR